MADDLQTPPALERALEADPGARAIYDALPPSHRREYARWIDEAKREETRDRRAQQALAKLREGAQAP